MQFCHGSNPLDLRDNCVRALWSTLPPVAFVSLLCVTAIPRPEIVNNTLRRLASPFRSFLTLAEAEAFEHASGSHPQGEHPPRPRAPFAVTSGMAAIGLLEVIAWLAIAGYRIIVPYPGANSVWFQAQPWLEAFAWTYASVRPIVNPATTVPFDLFAFYTIQLIAGAIEFGGMFFDHNIYRLPLPGTLVVLARSANMAAILVLLLIVFGRPMSVPSVYVEKEKIGQSVSPEDYTSLWGWMSFKWVEPLINRGTYATLNESDVWELSPTLQSRPVFIKFSQTRRKSLLRRIWAANSLDIILDFLLTFVSVIFNYAGPFFLKRILDALDNPSPERRAQAYIFAALAFLSTVLKAQADVQHLWFGRRAACRIRSELMAAIYDKALKRRDFSGIVNKVEKNEAEQTKKEKEKADDPKAGADVGKIVNLMATDATRISMMTSGMYFVYGAPFEIIIACTFLYQLLGISTFAGFVVLVLTWPLSSFITRRSIRIQKGTLASRDKRMAVLNELIGAVKFIKFFAWEDRWIQRTLDARKVELKWMVKGRINLVMFSSLWTTAPIMVSIISFFAFVAQGNELTVGTAFTAVALFSMVRQPLNILPAYIVQVLQTRVALKRIETFLNEDEVSDQVSTLKQARSGPSKQTYSAFGLKNASFRWNAVEEAKDDTDTGKKPATNVGEPDPSTVPDDDDRRFELRDMNVIFPEGELTVVTGPTASGKTALLLALLGELTMLPGNGEIIMTKDTSKVYDDGLMHAISYAAQSPWLQHRSIKDNILFGFPYDEERYNQVVECCALGPDLEILEDGDATEIGARGVSLSGGQKARVALARAVYARTKYILLDDPLSAVDSHTSRFLYERLFLGPLMHGRTVILVTHHVELVLPGAHYLVRMLDGRIDTQGTVKELRARGVLDEITQDSVLQVQEKVEATSEEADKAADVSIEAAEKKKKKPRKLVKDEERETGGVKWSIYKTYLGASSYWTWAILGTLVLIMQLLTVTEKWWIKVWGEAYGNGTDVSIMYHPTTFSSMNEHQAVMGDSAFPFHAQGHLPPLISNIGFPSNLPSAQENPLFYIGVYAAIGLTTALMSITSVITQYTGALRASKLLFAQLLTAVVRATMRWHDVTPTGRMLNRFSKDIETVDLNIAGSLQAVNSSMANFLSSVIVVIFIFPFFIIPASIMGYIYYRLSLGYLNTGRDLRRMESTSRSPIFSGFGELLEGIVTVRAFSAEDRFLDSLHKKIDVTTQMWYSFWMTNRWLLLHFDCVGAFGVFTTTLFALSGLVSAGLAGLCITSAMAFTNNIYWTCRFWTQLELDLNSVERVVEYLQLPQEPPAIIEGSRPPAHWPSGSENSDLMVVDDLVVKYAPDLPAVLHGVSFVLRGRERVGLLGRTGSGKSTLAMSILRFVDPTSGTILIDGIDITKIGVHDLRSRLTFIPQDATLFSGTLRDNLDPFGEYSDNECIDALYRVQMLTGSAYLSQKSSRQASRASSIHSVEREPVVNSAAGSIASATATETDAKMKISLETQVSAGGVNFSQGQRQLIAMARALLRQSSIIVLDEATSSIDFATDAKIQKTIREEFNNSLLLTVAHRLRTVIDYDRLIVLDKGTIAEFDTPHNLIQKEGGIFRSMCLQSGTFSELEEAARTKMEQDGGTLI